MGDDDDDADKAERVAKLRRDTPATKRFAQAIPRTSRANNFFPLIITEFPKIITSRQL